MDRMQETTPAPDAKAQGRVVAALGCFDGMHRGHVSVLKEAARLGRETGCLTMLVTFPRVGKCLTTEAEKAKIAKALGIWKVITLEKKPEDPAAYLKGELQVQVLVLGQGGTAEKELAPLAAAIGLQVRQVPEARVQGRRVTTAALERALEEENLLQYRELCGRDYELTGRIAHGKALGRTVGMPTANLEVDPRKKLPREGVYATITGLPEGRFMGLTNIGTRPTVDRESRVSIETYLFGFDRNIYGEEARLEVCFFIRGIRKFNSLEEVWEQVRRDEEVARQKLREIYENEERHAK